MSEKQPAPVVVQKNEQGYSICPCCETILGIRWTDHHGVAECSTCGVAFQVAGYRDCEQTTVLLDREELEACRAYWRAEQARMIWGDMYRFCGRAQDAEERDQHMKAWMQEHRPQIAAVWYSEDAP